MNIRSKRQHRKASVIGFDGPRGFYRRLFMQSGFLDCSRNLVSLLCIVLVMSAANAEDGRNLLPKKQHRDSNAPFLSPSEAVAKMSIPEGFDVSVFASEPDIAEPIAFCFDDRGRLWVAENFNYQTRRQHTDDQVSRCLLYTSPSPRDS